MKSKLMAFWAAVIVSLVTIVGAFTIAPSSSVQDAPDVYEVNEVEIGTNESVVELLVQILAIDERTQTVKGRVYIFPPKEYAVRKTNNVTLKRPMRAYFDVSRLPDANAEDQTFYWDTWADVGAVDFESDLSNLAFKSRVGDKYFPFDRYSMEFAATVEFMTKGGDTDDRKDDEWTGLPIRVFSYSAPIADWRITYSYLFRNSDMSASELETINDAGLKDLTTGEAAQQITFERPMLTQLIVLLLCIIFISGGFSMLFLFQAILFRRRPPTLSGLVWAASTAFTLIQTRQLLPTSPRTGVYLDIWIFYPSLTLCFGFGVMMFVYWLRAESWSVEDSLAANLNQESFTSHYFKVSHDESPR